MASRARHAKRQEEFVQDDSKRPGTVFHTSEAPPIIVQKNDGPILRESLRKILRLTTFRYVFFRLAKNLIPLRHHPRREIFRRIKFARTDQREKLTHPLPKTFSVRFRRLVLKARKILEITDQMSKTKLYDNMEFLQELAVRAEVIAADYALKIATEHLDQDLAAAGRVDFVQRE